MSAIIVGNSDMISVCIRARISAYNMSCNCVRRCGIHADIDIMGEPSCVVRLASDM